MKLVIKIENGLPVDHPILLENFIQCFPDRDENNLPDNYKIFERVPKPELGPYQIFTQEEPEYKLVNGKVQDVWHFRDMTPWEKQAKIDEMLVSKPHDAWVFNEDLCIWEPPVPYPDDGKDYTWRDDLNAWGEFIPPPEILVEAPLISNELRTGKITQITRQV